MRRSTRFRNTTAVAAVLATVAAALLPGRASALPPEGQVAARVNAESISEGDVVRLMQAEPGLPREKALERLIEESLVVQEAKRRKIDRTGAYQRMVQGWREDMASGLIGVDTLRRHVAKAEGRLQTFKEFYPRWDSVYSALPEAEAKAVDAQVEGRLSALRSAVSAFIDVNSMRKYAAMIEVPPEISSKVVATQTSFGPITLEDLLAEEPKLSGHVGQSEDDILKMWQQIAREIVGRKHVLQTAEKAGYFDDAGLRQQEERAFRDALRAAFLEQQISAKITRDVLIAKIDTQIVSWAATYALAIEQIRLVGKARVEADTMARAWGSGAKPPQGVKIETLSMGLAWPKFTPDQKRLVMDQPWGKYLPAVRVGDDFVLMHLMAASPPQEGARSLRDLARPLLIEEEYRALIAKLTREARITRP